MTTLKFLLLKAIGGFRGKIIKYRKREIIVLIENENDFFGHLDIRNYSRVCRTQAVPTNIQRS